MMFVCWLNPRQGRYYFKCTLLITVLENMKQIMKKMKKIKSKPKNKFTSFKNNNNNLAWHISNFIRGVNWINIAAW